MNGETILLLEDNPQNEMLTLRALRHAHLENRIDAARDVPTGAGLSVPYGRIH